MTSCELHMTGYESMAPHYPTYGWVELRFPPYIATCIELADIDAVKVYIKVHYQSKVNVLQYRTLHPILKRNLRYLLEGTRAW